MIEPRSSCPADQARAQTTVDDATERLWGEGGLFDQVSDVVKGLQQERDRHLADSMLAQNQRSEWATRAEKAEAELSRLRGELDQAGWGSGVTRKALVARTEKAEAERDTANELHEIAAQTLERAEAETDRLRHAATEWKSRAEMALRQRDAAERRADKAEAEHLDERDRHVQTMKRAEKAEAARDSLLNDLHAEWAAKRDYAQRLARAEKRIATVHALAMAASTDAAGQRQMDQHDFTANEILFALGDDE